MKAYQIKIELIASDPLIWRRIVMPADVTFNRLNDVIQNVTNIQKTIYFLQKLFNVPISYKYIFYKHGPFSFALRDELNELRAEKFLKLKSRRPYGSTFLLGDHSKVLKEKYGERAKKYEKQINYVAENISIKSVKDLEKLSTALYVHEEENITDNNKIVDKIIELKPHIKREEAREAVKEFFEFKDEIKSDY